MKEFEDERDEWKDKAKYQERRSDDVKNQMIELEREVRLMMSERERELKDSALRQTVELRTKEETKGRMLEDIQSLIKQFKEDKRLTKSQTAVSGLNYGVGAGATGLAYNSTSSSGYYWEITHLETPNKTN